MPLRILPLLLVLLTLSACKTSNASIESSHTTPASDNDAKVKAPARGDGVRVIYTLDWPGSWGQFLVGVGAKEALVMLEKTGNDPRLGLALIDIEQGRLIERWEANASRADLMINSYPGFRGMDGSFEGDLAKYASWLDRVGPWSDREAIPPLGVHVAPGAKQIIFSAQPDDGRDGDWLMLAGEDGALVQRLDDGMRASYNANFSPGGERVAWMGGSAQYARPGKQVGYVLRITSSDGITRDVPEVRDEIRTPTWSRDGEVVWALGKRKKRERCLFKVDAISLDARAVHCFAGPIDWLLSPDGQAMLLMLNPPKGGEMREVVLVDLDSEAEVNRMKIPGGRGMGRFGAWIDNKHAVLFARDGQALQIIEPRAAALVREIDLTPHGSIRGRLGTNVVDGELILLRQREGSSDVDLIGVRVSE